MSTPPSKIQNTFNHVGASRVLRKNESVMHVSRCFTQSTRSTTTRLTIGNTTECGIRSSEQDTHSRVQTIRHHSTDEQVMHLNPTPNSTKTTFERVCQRKPNNNSQTPKYPRKVPVHGPSTDRNAVIMRKYHSFRTPQYPPSHTHSRTDPNS